MRRFAWSFLGISVPGIVILQVPHSNLLVIFAIIFANVVGYIEARRVNPGKPDGDH